MSNDLESVFEQFEAAWSRGEHPELTAYLPSPGSAKRMRALRELIRIDLEFRWRSAQDASDNKKSRPWSLQEYHDAFPELTFAEMVSSQLIAEEYRARKRWGDRPDISEFASQFDVRLEEILPQLQAVDAELKDDATLAPSGINDDDATLPPLEVSDPDATLPPRNGSGQAGHPGANDEDTGTLPEVESTDAGGSNLQQFGNYDLLFEIARGGMGVVYKAQQRKLNRIVALKMIKSGQLASDDEVQRFYSEAEAAARLDHPHIVPVYDVGQENGQHFFSMGFVDGEGLDAKLNDGPTPPRDAAVLIRTIAEAVHFAHEKGIVHRDLKPANILIDVDGQPRITDFGLAKMTEIDSGLTATGQVMGTPSYMPPEQAAGKSAEIGPLSDVYSLGAVLYCLLTGRPPFQAANMMDTLLQVMEKEPVAPRQINAAVDADLETICLKCLQKSPSKRYSSAAALVEDLDRYLQNLPIDARPVGRVEKTVRWCRRNPVTAALSTLVVLLLVGGSTGAAVVAVRESKLRHDAEVAAEEETEARRREQTARMNAQQAQLRAERTSLELDQQKKQAIDQLYAATVGLAHQEWLANNIARAKQLLAECPAEQRGWEWHYLQGLCSNTVATLGGHRATMFVSFSRDGRRVLSLGQSAVARLWNWRNGRQLASAHDVIRIAPAGDLYLQYVRGVLTIRNASDGKTLQSIAIPQGRLCGAEFSNDGLYLALALVKENNTVEFFIRETLSGRQIARFTGKQAARASLSIGNLLSLAISPDHKTLASASPDATIKLWEIPTGNEIATLKGHFMTVADIAFDPAGERLASVGLDGTARLWDLKKMAQQRVLRGHVGNVYAVCFSPAGREIATAGWDRTIRLWSTATGQELTTLRGSHKPVFGCDISPDGRRLVAACGDGTVRVWDVERTTNLKKFIAQGTIKKPLEGPDGKTVLQELMGYLASHINEESMIVGGHDGIVLAATMNSDGSLAATAGVDRTIRIWDVASSRQLHLFKTHHSVYGLAFSPDGKHLAAPVGSLMKREGNKRSVPDVGIVKIWEVDSGKLVKTIQHKTGAPVISVAYSPDGRYLARATGFPFDYASLLTERPGAIGGIHVFDLKNDREAWSRRTHRNMVVRLSYSGDSMRLATSGQDASVQLWNARTGDHLFEISAADAQANRVAISPDGRQLAMASATGEVLIWDVETRQRVFKLHGHGDRAVHLVYTPDGSRLVSAGGDGTVRIWNPATGQELLTLRGHVNQVFTVATSGDGHRILSAGYDGIVKAWGARTPRRKSGRKFDEIVFRDDFERVEIGSRWQQSTGPWTIENGALKGRSVFHSTPALNAVYPVCNIRLRDLELPDESEVRFTVWFPEEISLQVVFQNQNQQRGEVVEAMGARNYFTRSKGANIVSQNGYLAYQVLNTLQQYELKPGIRHEVRIVRLRDELKLFIDGRPLLSTRHRTAANVGISLAAAYGKAGRVIYFDDFEVRTTRESLHRLAARKLVEKHFAAHLLRDEVIKRIRRNDQLKRAVRAAALKIVDEFPEDSLKLKAAAKKLVVRPKGTPADYRRGLQLISAARQLLPRDPETHTLLGIARYRNGQFKKAIEALEEANRLSLMIEGMSTPAQFAFLAMAYHQTNQSDEAQRYLTAATDAMHSRFWRENKLSQTTHEEAKSLIAHPETARSRMVQQLKRRVFDAIQAGRLDRDVKRYLAVWSADARSIEARGQLPGPLDYVRKGQQIEDQLRLALFSQLDRPRIVFENVEFQDKRDKTAVLRFDTVVGTATDLRRWRTVKTLKNIEGDWKITESRWWRLRRRGATETVDYTPDIWKQLDKGVFSAMKQGSLEATVVAYNKSLRYGIAQKLAAQLPSAPAGNVAFRGWVIRMNVAIRTGDLSEMRNALSNLTRLGPTNPDPWRKLIQFQLAFDQTADIEATIRRLPAKTPEHWRLRRELMFHYSKLLKNSGQLKDDERDEFLRSLFRKTTASLKPDALPTRPLLARVEHWIVDSQPWNIVGPFAGGKNLQGLDQTFEPEKIRKPEYDGKRGQVFWQKAVVAPGRVLDFHQHWPSEEYSAGFASATIHSPTQQRVMFWVGSDDGCKVWLNGKLVHSKRSYRAHRYGSDRFTVNLKKGVNELLIKVDQGNGKWELSVDVTDKDRWPANIRWTTGSIRNE